MAKPLVSLPLMAIATLLLISCGETPITAADPANERAVNMGETLYGEHCADCHGDNLQGQPDWKVRTADGTLPAPPHDETGHTWHHNDQLLFSYTKLGGEGVLPEGTTTAMPAFGEDISDEQIWAILSFIKSRWPIDVQQRQSTLNKP